MNIMSERDTPSFSHGTYYDILRERTSCVAARVSIDIHSISEKKMIVQVSFVVLSS